MPYGATFSRKGRRRRRFQFCIERLQDVRRLFLQLCNSPSCAHLEHENGLPLTAGVADDSGSFVTRFILFSHHRRPILVSRSRARSAARGTISCRSEASEAIPFPGADSIFSSACGTISRRLTVALSLSRGAPADRNASRLVKGSRAGSAARPYTTSCRFQAFETIPFPGADSIFSSGCGAISAISRRLRVALSVSRRDPGDRDASVQKIDDRLGDLRRDGASEQT
jgi:hypothetical protein